MPPCVLHIDIDAFFAAVEVMHNPRLAGRPVIIGGKPDERGVVCTASYEARAFGVHSGMSLRMAGRKCPQGIFLRGRYHVYQRISRAFFACLRRFSPRVEEVSIDEAYMDLNGMSYMSESVYALAGRIKREAERAIGIKVSAGLGFTRMGAKLASEAAKPGGLFFVFNETEFVRSMALERIPGIGPQTQMILNGLGIRRVGELEKRYPSIWKRAVGVHLLGGSGLLPRREPASRSFSRETTFREDIADTEMIMAHLAYLVERLALHLAREKLFAGRIEVKVRFSDFTTFTARSLLQFPTFSHTEMWRSAVKLLLKLVKRRDLALRLVGVKVEDISEQRDLLPFVDLRAEKLSRGIREVKNRYGFCAITTGRSLLLDSLYERERNGLVLKTASLTK